jgi:hypothetical protein
VRAGWGRDVVDTAFTKAFGLIQITSLANTYADPGLKGQSVLPGFTAQSGVIPIFYHSEKWVKYKV